ncbi:MAG TPA: decaprenyl-phosphate phosphoribosyltransferase [Candidatus Nanoarchaeia archaeon]|nr:decaprenyl-phosphate phosphoribosyltransferase [Candidatus Nanoarchaeia archaeon]
MNEWLSLIRVRQWYKNLVVFLALFFSGNLFNLSDLYLTVIAFFSLAFISSTGYIVNDLVDTEKDKLNPEKISRPLASGKIGKMSAGLLGMLLLGLGLILAFKINPTFLYIIILFFVLELLYTFFLKSILIADILTISTLFVVRAISGAFAINVKVSPWLILCPFFLSLFLSVGKRQAEMQLLKEKAASTRTILKEYDTGLTNSLMIISTTLLVISYALYSFLSEHPDLLYTLPFALFVIFRFYYLINSGSVISRHPEKVLSDRSMLIGIILWVVVTGMMIYW